MHIREYYPALPNLKNILMGKWYLIQNQPSICEKYLQGATPHFISQMKIPTRHSSKSLTIKAERAIYLRTAGVMQAREHL